jgi:hypothetical protein
MFRSPPKLMVNQPRELFACTLTFIDRRSTRCQSLSFVVRSEQEQAERRSLNVVLRASSTVSGYDKKVDQK